MIHYVSPTFYCCGVHRRVHDSFCSFCSRERRARHPLPLGLLAPVAPEAEVVHAQVRRRDAQGAHNEGNSQIAPLGSLACARRACVAVAAEGAAAEAGPFSRPPDALAASSRARCSQQSHPQGAADDTLGLAARVVLVRAPPCAAVVRSPARCVARRGNWCATPRHAHQRHDVQRVARGFRLLLAVEQRGTAPGGGGGGRSDSGAPAPPGARRDVLTAATLHGASRAHREDGVSARGARLCETK